VSEKRLLVGVFGPIGEEIKKMEVITYGRIE